MNTTTKQQKGFTLIETLVAILILTLSIGALLSLASGGFYSVRYSRNQIVANNLLQESIEYIRNSRDTSFEQGVLWSDWQAGVLSVDTLGNPTGTGSDGCFSVDGCFVDPYTTGAKIKQCEGGGCPFVLYYPSNAFYGYQATYPFPPSILSTFETSFVRTIKIRTSDADPEQLIVNATVSWLNGSNPRSIEQEILITNWRQ
jgi:prepilin-type N-terminal cleavage/methylation domain-containing protein